MENAQFWGMLLLLVMVFDLNISSCYHWFDMFVLNFESTWCPDLLAACTTVP